MFYQQILYCIMYVPLSYILFLPHQFLCMLSNFTGQRLSSNVIKLQQLPNGKQGHYQQHVRCEQHSRGFEPCMQLGQFLPWDTQGRVCLQSMSMISLHIKIHFAIIHLADLNVIKKCNNTAHTISSILILVFSLYHIPAYYTWIS